MKNHCMLCYCIIYNNTYILFFLNFPEGVIPMGSIKSSLSLSLRINKMPYHYITLMPGNLLFHYRTYHTLNCIIFILHLLFRHIPLSLSYCFACIV